VWCPGSNACRGCRTGCLVEEVACKAALVKDKSLGVKGTYLAYIVPAPNIIINYDSSSHHNNYANSTVFLRNLAIIVAHYNTFVILVGVTLGVVGMDRVGVFQGILLLVLMGLTP